MCLWAAGRAMAASQSAGVMDSMRWSSIDGCWSEVGVGDQLDAVASQIVAKIAMHQSLELAFAQLANRIGLRKAKLGDAGMAAELIGARSQVGKGVAPGFAEAVELPAKRRMDDQAASD